MTGDYPTATQLSLASAVAEPGRVTLIWHGARAAQRSVVVQRRDEGSGWLAIGEPRHTHGLLTFEDRTVTEGRYAYRLVSARDADEVLVAEVWVSVPGGPLLSIAGFTPNPATSAPVVSFSLPNSGAARLALHDVSGREVHAQEVGALGSGPHRLALTRSGPMPAGVYWLRLTQDGRSVTAKGLVAP